MVKKIVSYIIIILQIVLIFLSLMLNILNNQILNEEIMLKRLGRIDYYNKAYEIILTDMKSMLEPSGFDERILEDTFSVSTVRQEVENIILSIYNNRNYEINTKNFEDKVKQNVNQLLVQQSRILNSTEEQAIDEFIIKLGDIFEEEIFPHKYISFIKEYMPKIINLSSKATLVSYIVNLVLIAILILINLKNGIMALKYTCICVIASGIVVFIPNILANVSLNVRNISIVNVNVSVLLQQIIIDILEQLKSVGIIFTISGMALLFFANYCIIKKKKKHKHKIS